MGHIQEECSFFASVGFDVEGTKCVGQKEVRKSFQSLWENYLDAYFDPIGEDFFLRRERL